ncbi:hypothetical protein LguiA_017800 [Lonicera macranthoides]
MEFSKGTLNSPPAFDGNNFQYWKVRMSAFLQALGDEVWFMVEAGYTPPTKTVGTGTDAKIEPKPLAEWTAVEKSSSQSNSKGRNAIFMAVGESEFKRISTCKSSKEAWDILIKAHEGDEKVKQSKVQMLVNQFNTLMMDENEKYDDFYLRLTDLVNKLGANGIKYSDSEIVLKILRSLTDKFEPKKYAIEESNDLNTLSPEILSSKLRVFEMELDLKKSQRGKNKNQSIDSTLAFASSFDPDLTNFVQNNGEIDLDSLDEELARLSKYFKKLVKFRNTFATKQGRSLYQNNSHDRNGYKDLSHIQCRKCQKYGHYANKCPSKKNQNRDFHDIEDTMNVNVCDTSDVDSDLDENVNYIAFISSVSSDNVDYVSTCSDDSENECSDALNYQKMYALEVEKCLKLGKVINKLNTKTENLNTQIKMSAEESIIQCQSFEQEKEKFLSKIKELEDSNKVLEQKYKAALVENEETKQKLSSAFKKLNDFEKGSKKLESILSSQKVATDKYGLGFKPFLSFQDHDKNKTVFVKQSNVETSNRIHNIAQKKNDNEFVNKKHSNGFIRKPYCPNCDMVGHALSSCFHIHNRPNHEKFYYKKYNGNFHTNSFGYNKDFSKRNPKGLRRHRFYQNGIKQIGLKTYKAIWVRKDDLEAQMIRIFPPLSI